MYLVTMSCQLDDIPLCVFGQRDAAIEFIKGHSMEVPESTLEMLSIDPPETLGLALWHFGNDGLLASREIIRWFGEAVA